MIYYILNKEKKAIPCDVLEWSKMLDQERKVRRTEINDHAISTVFLGLNYNHLEEPPLLFETMIFDLSGNSIYCHRSSTWDEAEEVHRIAKEWLLIYIENGCRDEDSMMNFVIQKLKNKESKI